MSLDKQFKFNWTVAYIVAGFLSVVLAASGSLQHPDRLLRDVFLAGLKTAPPHPTSFTYFLVVVGLFLFGGLITALYCFPLVAVFAANWAWKTWERRKLALELAAKTGMAVLLVSFWLAPSPMTAATAPAIFLKEGTEIIVRTIGVIDSATSGEGKTFPCSIAAPILGDNGRILLPAGEDCVLSVTRKREAGKFAGHASLTLELTSLTVDGHLYPLVTEGVEEKGPSRGVGTTRAALLGAGLGIVVAGITRTGPVAMAAGAGAGAAAGGWLGSRIKPNKVTIPPETQITFTLRDPAAFGGGK